MQSAQRRIASIAQQLVPQQQACEAQGLSMAPCAAILGGTHLAGQVAIVTGAGGGIGEATALLFAAQGAAVVVTDLNAEAAQKVVDAIKSSGGRAVAVSGDVTAPDAAAKIVKAAMDNFGRIDILVNNAGFTWDGVIHKMTQDQWDIILAVHCTAPFRLIQACEPHMRGVAKAEIAGPSGAAAPRNIINISSTTGTHGNGGQINYATAKAGVIGMTKSVAKEWGPFNIRCNALAFGLIDTRLTQPKEDGNVLQVGGKAVVLGMPQGVAWRKAAEKAIPLRRIGTAADAAGAIMMLVSPWAAFITGEVVECNGGSYM